MSKTDLTPKLLEVAQLLASGLSYQQISEATGVARSTIGRWAKLEAVEVEVESIRAEALEAHRQISREAATQSAEDLQLKLGQSIKRQEEMIRLGYSLGVDCFALTQRMLKKASEIFADNRPIEAHEKILISSLPSLMKAAGDTLRAASDVEDKLFALEEVVKRLDEWRELQNNQN